MALTPQTDRRFLFGIRLLICPCRSLQVKTSFITQSWIMYDEKSFFRELASTQVPGEQVMLQNLFLRAVAAEHAYLPGG